MVASSPAEMQVIHLLECRVKMVTMRQFKEMVTKKLQRSFSKMRVELWGPELTESSVDVFFWGGDDVKEPCNKTPLCAHWLGIYWQIIENRWVWMSLRLVSMDGSYKRPLFLFVGRASLGPSFGCAETNEAWNGWPQVISVLRLRGSGCAKIFAPCKDCAGAKAPEQQYFRQVSTGVTCFFSVKGLCCSMLSRFR